MRFVLSLMLLILLTISAGADYVTVNLQPVANRIAKDIPNKPVGRQTFGGVPFELLPNSANNSWSAAVGTKVGVQSTQTMVLSVDIHGATAIDTLISTYDGAENAPSYVSLIFVCSDGATHVVHLKEGSDIRDWFEGGFVNKINGTTTTEVFSGTNHGRIDKQHISLPSDFAGKTLSYIILTDHGVTGNEDVAFCKSVHAQRCFIYGVTVTTGNAQGDVVNSQPDPSLEQTPKAKIGAASYDDFAEPWRSRFIQNWEKEIAAMKQKIKSGPPQTRAASKQRLKELEKNDPPFIGTSGFDSGVLADQWQVGFYGHASHGLDIIQVIPPNHILLGNDTFGPVLMLQVDSTAGLLDGRNYWLPDKFVVIDDTTTYNSVGGGTKTVLAGKVIDIESLKKK